MGYNKISKIWPNNTEYFFRDYNLKPLKQKGTYCVSTSLAIITGETPEYFQKLINTQDSISWSEALRKFNMKLAYCPVDIRKIKFYINELIALDDLFLLSYYSPIGEEILKDPDHNGWLVSSHIVVLHRSIILDSKSGNISHALKHECNSHHTKRTFRVIPLNHSRGL